MPLYSLYSETRKPTPAMLADVDTLVVDLQDIGTRIYTYIYTMSYVMEAAAEQGKTVVVLDRPNPIGGVADPGHDPGPRLPLVRRPLSDAHPARPHHRRRPRAG